MEYAHTTDLNNEFLFTSIITYLILCVQQNNNTYNVLTFYNESDVESWFCFCAT